MRTDRAVLLAALLWAPAALVRAQGWGEAAATVSQDYRTFYSPSNALWLAAGFGGAALLAHTSADRRVQKAVRGSTGLAEAVRPLGFPEYQFPVYAAAYAWGRWGGAPGAGAWSERSVRAYLVAAAPMRLLQSATGAGRPNEGSSDWHPFEDDNGISGEAFFGAIPVLTAARMAERPWLKAALYGASALPGLGRMRTGHHYLSQAALGWGLAYLAVVSVEPRPGRWEVRVQPGGASLSARF